MKTAGQKEGAGLLEALRKLLSAAKDSAHGWTECARDARELARTSQSTVIDAIAANAPIYAKRLHVAIRAAEKATAIADDRELLLRALMMGAAVRISDRVIRIGTDAYLCARDAAGHRVMPSDLRAALRKVVAP